MCLAGTGTTFTLSVQTNVGRLISVGEIKESIERIPDDDIESTGFSEFCPGTKTNHEALEMPVVFEGAALKTLGTLETGTITWPVNTGAGHTTPATYAGSGFLSERSIGAAENNQRIEGSYTWVFDGKTGPAFVAGS